jgi:hypothetical protein
VVDATGADPSRPLARAVALPRCSTAAREDVPCGADERPEHPEMIQ